MWTRCEISLLLAIVLCGAAAYPAHAAEAPDSGEMLLNSCTIAERFLGGDKNIDRAQAYRVGICFGMIQAVTDTTVAHGLQGGGLFCPPSKISRQDTLAVLLQYLRAHPEARRYPMTAAVILAFQAAYPCE